MRRIFISAALGLLALSAGAQDTYFAELLSRNNYYGTARSIGLGNAVTALGGDLGSVGINPAGSAVNSFGQFTLTPAILFQNTGVSAAADGVNFSSPSNTSHNKFNLPNIGGTIVCPTGNNYGLKHVTFGVICNVTDTYLNYTGARMSNASTSFLANLAAAAEGLSPSDMPDDLYAAYCANQFGAYGPGNSYAGANQRWNVPSDGDRPQWDNAYAYVPGAVDQVSEYNTYGTKMDFIINLGFDISDSFYFGFNIGLPAVEYRRSERFSEYAGSSVVFPNEFYDQDGNPAGVTNWVSSVNAYKLNTDASGIYAKFGLIWLPTKSLRIGAAIQTPTSLNIEDTWQYGASSSYEDSKFNGNAYSDIRSYNYRLRTPYVANAGVAYTIPGLGLVSVDYELTDYSVMKFSDTDSYFDGGTWDATNEANSLFCGLSHSLRAGVEVTPFGGFSLRAGYSFVSDPERYALDAYGSKITAETWEGPRQMLGELHYFKNATHGFSFGAGYSSASSFFCDAAFRLTKYPTVYYSPYYYGNYAVYDKDRNLLGMDMPLERFGRSIFDVVLTLGWRF